MHITGQQIINIVVGLAFTIVMIAYFRQGSKNDND